ncbi:hypothetical protein COY33_02325 [candidate division WWE3 bacterium CG_4_10_14_0_2_um_filter_42_7]|uniref:Glycosyltransferase family 1 protein n=2 Tax=Katanobacteria TaxID=422282 RepID=A0A2H0X8M3_UNCKA|nr:MAG: hypothetical protein COT51_04100 [candidate division WWE3 bacterium CG08_land_8_20_14_0_20_41_15]PIZ42932.1 MAG: hypothetical protein COY33_02325 [candidate division WWE3 bacterium CG_4_10_14_0_2_um_filter_42_7]
MKILFIHRWVGVHEGGTETHIKEVASFMARQGHEVYILTRKGPALSDFDPKVKVVTVGKTPGESQFSYKSMYDPRLWFYTGTYVLKILTRLLGLWIKGIRFNVVSVHFLVESKAARIFRFLTKTPFIFVIEGYTDAEAKEARHANLVMASSQHELDECYKHYGYKPVLKPHGIDLKRFRKDADKNDEIRKRYVKEGEKLVVTVCRLEPRKDLPTLIKAAKVVKEKNPKIKFVVVGEGVSGEELHQMVKDLGLSDTISFAGRVSEEDLPKYYAAGDLYALPTLYEGFGIVYLEAMASECPVLSTKVGAIPEVVEDDGVLIEPKDPEKLAEKILEILENEKLRMELVDKGLKKVREKYDREKVLGIFEESLENLLKNK